jgi:hypothetical protein
MTLDPAYYIIPLLLRTVSTIQFEVSALLRKLILEIDKKFQ